MICAWWCYPGEVSIVPGPVGDAAEDARPQPASQQTAEGQPGAGQLATTAPAVAAGGRAIPDAIAGETRKEMDQSRPAPSTLDEGDGGNAEIG